MIFSGLLLGEREGLARLPSSQNVGPKQTKMFCISSLCSLQSLGSDFTGVTASVALGGVRTAQLELGGGVLLTLQGLVMVKPRRGGVASMKQNLATALLSGSPAVCTSSSQASLLGPKALGGIALGLEQPRSESCGVVSARRAALDQ